MSYETSILSSFSMALLLPGAFSSPSAVMFSHIFWEWSGKTTVSILILWIWSVADCINRLIEMCSWYQSQKGCFLTIFVYSFEGSKILCFYWLFMLWPFVCLHRRSLRAQHELCFLYRLKCKILSRYCNSFARREFPALV